MSSKGTEVLKEALSLTPAERAEIAESLLSSLDLPSQEAIDALWGKRRKSGWMHLTAAKIQAISARQVFEQMDKKPR